MERERSKSDRDRNLPIEAHGPPKERGNPTEATPEYDALLRRYAEAMQRIGQLEARVESLTRLLEGVPAAPEFTPKEASLPTRLVDEDAAQLRIQISNLAGQLTRTEGQLAEVLGARVRTRRRRGRDRPPKWKFWRRSSRH